MDKLDELSNSIKYYRKQRGWSQRELARRAGVSHSLIANIERGDNIPSLKTLYRIADAMQMPMSQFFLHIEYNYSTQNSTS